MNGQDIRARFLSFFKERGHAVVPSSSLVPDDPSVLLTTAGMQQFKPYFTGELNPESDFGSQNTASTQKCFRTSDIEEVGDESHLTFFEMLGNFSFGGYFKEKAIRFGYEFIVEELGLTIDYVSVFGGDAEVPADETSEAIWKSLGITDVRRFGREDNFWGPTGSEGPCGPTTEIYVDGIEVWNIVFNEYFMKSDQSLTKLKQPGVDTGMGLERLTKVAQGVSSVFDTNLFQEPLGSVLGHKNKTSARIVADHLRGAVFLLADGVLPANKEAGYVLRRLIRRLIVHAKKMEVSVPDLMQRLDDLIQYYGTAYPELQTHAKQIRSGFQDEAEQFERIFQEGLQEFEKRYGSGSQSEISGSDAFDLYQSFGFPFEAIQELAEERGYTVDSDSFWKKVEAHKDISRAGAEKKFGGHGLVLDTGELKASTEEEKQQVLRLHTATHLLHQALRQVVGDEVAQQGSDITAKRLRFDFSLDRKLTPEELARVEDIVNEKIDEDLPVRSVELPKEEAMHTGALSFFRHKYPDVVTVYYVGEKEGDIAGAFSKEFCGGPHVARTGDIGSFAITKQESVGRNIKRIRAVVGTT